MMKEPRYQRVKTCAECGMCKSKKTCDPARKPTRPYTGFRWTSDGFDCALPVAIDSHSVCSFGCLYCFSDNLAQHRQQSQRPIGQTDLRRIDNVFGGKGGKFGENIRMALKYNNRNEHGYPAPVQLGAITDPMDNIERQQGWLLEFIKLAIKHDQPVRISTKGIMALQGEYLDAFAKKPELFWVAFSIISPDDKVISQVDRRAPVTSKRIEAMKNLSDIGVKTSLRFRPILPGISDATKDHPQAYKDLIDMAKGAGAKAISYEVCFLPGMPTDDLRERYKRIEEISGKPLRKIYSSFGKAQACTRASYKWTEGIMWAIHDHAKKKGLQIGVSDPIWKQLSEYGCCCGIRPDDPVHGNWERENATNALLRAKRGEIKEIGPEDIIPPWAYKTLAVNLMTPGIGPKHKYRVRHMTWADELRNKWNDPAHDRGPFVYFQGALRPHREDEDGNVYYKYVGLKRSDRTEWPYWTVN